MWRIVHTWSPHRRWTGGLDAELAQRRDRPGGVTRGGSSGEPATACCRRRATGRRRRRGPRRSRRGPCASAVLRPFRRCPAPHVLPPRHGQAGVASLGRRGNRVQAVALQRRGNPELVLDVEIAEGFHAPEPRPAAAQGSGLVEHDVGGRGQRAQRLAIGRQHAELRQRAVGDGERGRHRQRERARAADHQQGEGDLERTRRVVYPPPDVHQHRRHRCRPETAGNASASCAARAMRLRAFHQPLQLRRRVRRAHCSTRMRAVPRGRRYRRISCRPCVQDGWTRR